MKPIRDGVFEMRCPDNWHAHFRQDELLRLMVELLIISGWRGRVVGMPNTRPPILTGEQAELYRKLISDCASSYRLGEYFTPVIAIQGTEETTPEMIRAAAQLGIKLVKFYPKNMTTHSENGVFDYEKVYSVLEVIEEVGMIASFHGEHPSSDVEGIDKERAFLDNILTAITQRFKNLKIVLEHITTSDAVDFVTESRNVHATITVHHLALTLDDVIGYSLEGGFLMRPHNFCKPIAKTKKDRWALIDAATSGKSKFFYGGDDAAHSANSKHCDGICAGVFNTLVAIPMLVEIFETIGALPLLEAFLSEFGAAFYGFHLNEHTIRVKREDWTVPSKILIPRTNDIVIPWIAGKVFPWKVL